MTKCERDFRENIGCESHPELGAGNCSRRSRNQRQLQIYGRHVRRIFLPVDSARRPDENSL